MRTSVLAQPDASATSDRSTLESALGYRFERPELLTHALTHRSLAYEQAMDSSHDAALVDRTDNERLEFLGDAVLGLVVAEGLFQSHPDWSEGELTRLRAQLVSRRNMALVAQAIGLGEHLLLGKGEERSGGRKKSAILANAMEAVIAAMYLDAGPAAGLQGALQPVRNFAGRYIFDSSADALARDLRSGAALGDHKSALQEHLQATRASVPVYRVESESGPDHRKRFQVEVRVRNAYDDLGEQLAIGIGSTKKKAEQEAARRALQLLIALAPSDEDHEEPAGL